MAALRVGLVGAGLVGQAEHAFYLWEERERFSFVGLIGSATKRARFLSQMRAAGLTEVQLARLVSPIGVPGLESKDPAVIAASTAAQLLIVSESLAREEDEAPLGRRRNESPASAL